MTILVTGGTGFIGSHVLRRLVERGHRACCLVRPTSDTVTAASLGVELRAGDVTDASTLAPAMERCDAVIHLAGIYDFWIRDKRLYEAVNVQGTRNVMEAALASGVSKVIHVSSLVAYGTPADRPFAEGSTPGAVIHSRYARSKLAGDRVVQDLREARGLPVVVVYPGAVIGSGDNKPSGRYVADLASGRMPAQVLQDSVLTWVAVADVAEVIIRALEKDGNLGERYFVGAERLTIGCFNEIVSQVAGVRLPRLSMPAWMAAANAAVLTFIGDLVGLRPMLGMSSDQIRTMARGFSADCSKVTRELGIRYTPIAEALREQMASRAAAAAAGPR